MRPSIIFDFDGTLALGFGPVRVYALGVTPYARPGFTTRVDRALASYSAGDGRYRDGYDAVAQIAIADGVGERQLDAAYRDSRALLGTSQAPVEPPEGAAALLKELHRHATLILATNAPEIGISDVLSRWGVLDLFEELHFSVGKPEGLVKVVRTALTRGPALAVGDILDFDLAPARALGAATALVGPRGTEPSPGTTFHGASLHDIRNDLQTWAAATASSTPAPHDVGDNSER